MRGSQFFYFLKSVQLSSIYFLSGRSSTTPYAIFYIMFMDKISSQVSGGGGGRRGTPYDGLFGEAPPKRGIFFRPRVYERVRNSLLEVYKRVGKSVIWVCDRAQKELTDAFYSFITLRSHFLPLFISYRSSGEKLIKYQANSSCVIVSVILMTSLFYKALISQGEI